MRLRRILAAGSLSAIVLATVAWTHQSAAGPVGDGKADDTAALQALVDSGRGSILLKKGTYRITRPLVVDLDKVGHTAITGDGTARIVMAGPGPAIRFVGTHEGTAAPNSVKANVWDRQRMPSVSGIEIIGANPEADGIEASGTFMLTLHRVAIRECRHGVHLVKRNRNVIISDCHIYSNRGTGVFYDDVNLHQSNIVGSHISYCDGGGVVCRGGEVRNVHITGCDIEANMKAGGPTTANVFIDCTGGSTAEVAITGCTIQHSNVPDGANVRVHGAGSGIRKGTTANWGHITIGNNVFSDVAINVDLKDCRGVTITGNTFWMAYQHNLKVVNCEQLAMAANAFERNPAYDYGTSKTTVNAILFENCRDCTLSGLHVHGVHTAPAAVALDRCSRINLTACTILDCDGVGLLLNEPKNCRVSDCLIRHDGDEKKPRTSIRVVGGSGNLFADNSFGNGVEIPKESGTVR